MQLSRALLPIALAAGVASADPFFSNLATPTSVGTAFGIACSFTQFKAAGFTMGPDAYVLNSVTLDVNTSDPDSPASVQIWSGTSAPTTFIADLTGPLLNGPGEYIFTPDSALTLEADTTYWLYVENNFDQCWTWNGRTATPSGIGATHVGYIFNGGSSSFFNAYELDGTIATGGCGPADISSPANPGIPDGLLSGADFFEFLVRFEIGDLSVDFSSPGNPGSPDGLLTGADFLFYLNLFAQGC